MGEVNGVRKSHLASGVVKREYLVWVSESYFSAIYYCEPESLSTFCRLDISVDEDMLTFTLKELLERDEKVIQEKKKSSFSQRNFGSKKYSDPLFFSFVNESQLVDRYYKRFNCFVELSVTNFHHLEGHIRAKSGASLGESTFILYPFRDLKGKYIELYFQPPYTLLMIRSTEEKKI